MHSSMPCGPTGCLIHRMRRCRPRCSGCGSGCAFPGRPTVVTRAAGLCARVGLGARVDALEFERAVRAAIGAEPAVARARLHDALSLWRGAPYAGFEDVDALRAEQIRLEELHLQAIEAYAEALLACGEPNRAITELDSFVSQYPLRADAQATLMRALAATGRDAEALRVFQAHRQQLGRRAGFGAVTTTPTIGSVDPAR